MKLSAMVKFDFACMKFSAMVKLLFGHMKLNAMVKILSARMKLSATVKLATAVAGGIKFSIINLFILLLKKPFTSLKFRMKMCCINGNEMRFPVPNKHPYFCGC